MIASIIFLILSVLAVIGIGQIFKTYGAVNESGLPEIGKWTNCQNLTEVCDVPEFEIHNLTDLAVYRFENGSMIVEYIGDSPIEK